MKSVQSIANKNIVTVSKEQSCYDVALEMKKFGIGFSIVVCENSKICGAISERDFLFKLIAGKLNPEETKVSEIMSSPIITVEPNVDVNEAWKIMQSNNIRHLPVAETDGEIIGLIGIRDVMMSLSIENELTSIFDKFDF